MRIIIFFVLITLISMKSYGQEIPRLVLPQGHTNKVVSMCFLGDRLVSVDEGDRLILWDLDSQKEVGSIQFESKVLSMFENDAGNLAVSLEGGDHLFYSTRNLDQKDILTIDGAEYSAFYEDEIFYIKKDIIYKNSAPEKRIVQAKNIKLKRINNQLFAFSNKFIYGISNHDSIPIKTYKTKGVNKLVGITENGHFVSQDEKGILYLKNGNSPNMTLNKFFIPTLMNTIVWAEMAEEKTFCMSDEPMIYVFDKKLKMTNSFGIREGKSTYAKLNGDGSQIAIAFEGKICIYETASGKKSKTLNGNHSNITSMIPDQNNNAVAVTFANGEITYLPIEHEKESYFGKLRLSNRDYVNGWNFLIKEATKIEENIIHFEAVKFKNDKGLVSKIETYEASWNFKSDKFDLLKIKEKKIAKKKRIEVSDFVSSCVNDVASVHLNTDVLDLTKTDENEISIQTKEQTLKVLFFDQGDIIYKRGSYYFGKKDQSENIAFADKAGNIYHVNQFDPYFNRPDKVFEGMPFVNSDLIELYEKARLKRWSKIGITSETPDLNNIPSLQVDFSEQFEVSDNQQKIQIHSRDKSGLATLHIYVNGVPEKGKEGERIGGKEFSEERSIVLNSGLNKLEIFTLNTEGVASNIVEFQLDCTAPAVPDLFVVSIGVSDYKQSDFSLSFAAKDAEDFSNSFTRSEKEYGSVRQLKLLNADFNTSSTSEIEKFLSTAGHDDVVIFYYAGHGVLDQELNYYLCPTEMNFFDPKENGISYEKVESLLTNCNSRNKVLILDACHSGEIDADDVSVQKSELETNEELTFRASGNAPKLDYSGTNVFDFSKQLFIDTRLTSGLMVVTSSSGLEYSLEGENWNNGLFTYFVLEGLLKQRADLNKDGEIYLRELFLYVKENVNRCSEGEQTPTIREENHLVNVKIR